MNKEELKELGETLIGISHGELWQFRKSENFPDSRWVDAGMMADPARILKDGGEIRLKPWELTGTVNGHTLPPGASWHRQDFTEDMLPADPPHRPLMDGEVPCEYDQFSRDTEKWVNVSIPRHNAVGSDDSYYRTTRPIPPSDDKERKCPHCEYAGTPPVWQNGQWSCQNCFHSMEQPTTTLRLLTPEKIAEGWLPWSGGECPVEPESVPEYMMRKPDKDEPSKDSKAITLRWSHEGAGGDIIAYRPDPYGKFRQALAEGKEIEYQATVGGQWYSLSNEMEVGFIAPPEAYRIKEPQWLPLVKTDIPPGSVLCPSGFYDNGRWFSIRAVLSDCVLTDGAENDDDESKHITFESLMSDGWQINRSISDGPWDANAWEPCRKEAKPSAAILSPDSVAEQQEAEEQQDQNSSALQTVANSRPEIPPYRDSYTAAH